MNEIILLPDGEGGFREVLDHQEYADWQAHWRTLEITSNQITSIVTDEYEGTTAVEYASTFFSGGARVALTAFDGGQVSTIFICHNIFPSGDWPRPFETIAIDYSGNDCEIYRTHDLQSAYQFHYSQVARLQAKIKARNELQEEKAQDELTK